MKIIIFAIVRALLVWGVSGVGSDRVAVFVIEGDSVTLYTGVQTNQQDRIKWYFNDIRIAQINRDQSKICTDVQCEERFRDRLKLDHQTGSLIITNTRNTDSGEYQLKILSKSSFKIFNVTVTGVLDAEMDKKKMVMGEPFTSDTVLHKKTPAPVAAITCALVLMLSLTAVGLICKYTKSGQRQILSFKKAFTSVPVSVVVAVSVAEGDSVTLKTNVSQVQRDDHIMWLFEAGDTLIAKIIKGTKETHDGPKGRFRGRLELNDQTGSLTITNTRETDSGEYKLKSIRSGETSSVRYSVTVFRSISRGIQSDEHLKPLSTGFDMCN